MTESNEKVFKLFLSSMGRSINLQTAIELTEEASHLNESERLLLLLLFNSAVFNSNIFAEVQKAMDPAPAEEPSKLVLA